MYIFKPVAMQDVKRFMPKPTPGTYIIAIVPYIQWDKPGPWQYKHEFRAHFYEKDSILCIPPCSICNLSNYLKSFTGAHKQAGQRIQASKRVLYNVIDYDDPEDAVRIWHVSHWFVQRRLEETFQNTFDLIDPLNGKDIHFRIVQKGHIWEYQLHAFTERKTPLSEEDLDAAVDPSTLIHIPTNLEKDDFRANIIADIGGLPEIIDMPKPKQPEIVPVFTLTQVESPEKPKEQPKAKEPDLKKPLAPGKRKVDF